MKALIFHKNFISSILLISSVLVLSDCTKNPNPNYTQNIGRTWNWHRHYHVSVSYPGSTYSDTTYNYTDTSFSVIPINNSTINILGQTFSFEKADAVNHIYYFGTGWEYLEYLNGTGVVYYYTKDSLVYGNGVAGHDGIQDLEYYTY